METKRTADHSEDAESSMQHLNKRFNAENHIAGNEANSDELKGHKNGRVEVMIDNLPTEMLEAILRNVATSDLLNCRLMNREWNEISSNIMCQRNDIQIVFSIQNGRLMQTITHRDDRDQESSKSMSFGELIECLKRSQHFPFANFRFKDMGEKDEMKCFLSIWGQNIYELGVEICISNDIEILRALLLNETPNLRKFHINFHHNWLEKQEVTSVVHLFDESNEFKLPKLNVLRVQNMCKNDFGIVADILKAASNLDSFELVSESYNDDSLFSQCIKAEELSMLQSLDKLHCLKRVSLSFDELSIGFLEESPQFVNLQFESIIMSTNKMFSPYTTDEAKIINKIFDASKNSLFELNISPLGVFPGLVLPKFENLEKLTLSHDVHDGRFMFPRHFDMTDSFPNLRELAVDIFGEDDYFSTYHPSNVMPKVEYLEIIGDCTYDKQLMKMTPNVKTLKIEGEDDELPNMNYNAISTYLTKLENLKWDFHTDPQSSCELESMITGFSEKFCKKMSVQFRDKDSLSAKEVASYEAKRLHLSILDLPGLKRLDIKLTRTTEGSDFEGSTDGDESCDMAGSDDDENCDMVGSDDDESCDMAGFHRGSIFYKTGLTKVSKFLAFDLKPNLETNIQVLFE